MYNKLKKKIKRFVLGNYAYLFFYPKKKITLQDNHDYDSYWTARRGSNLGVLTDWQKDRADMILERIKSDSVTGPVNIGDIGCGDGSILKYLSEHLKTGALTGYDNSEPVLKAAENFGIKAVKLDLGKDDELEKIEQADYILLLEIIEHMPNSEAVLGLAFSRSNKGVFFSIPNTGYIKHRTRMLLGRFPAQWVNFPNEHVRFWTLGDVKWWLSAQDYGNFEIRCYRGVPVLNKLWPSMFAAGLLVFIKK